MNLDKIHSGDPLLTGLAILAGVALVLLITNRLRKMTGQRATLLMANILTVIAAVLATMVSASGMWKFFTDILGPSPLRIVFFAYIEVALFASALLARARLLREPEHGSTGIDGVAVWAFAAITATLSALDADTFREVCLRLVAPLAAAWMWERALAAERTARLGRVASIIHWTLTTERILVWLRLAEAHGRDVTEVDRARRRARLGRARLNLTMMQSRKRTPAWRLRRAHHKVIRQAMRAAQHIGLADIPDAANEREAIQMYLATLYGFIDATTPEAVAHLNAWRDAFGTREPYDVGQQGRHNSDVPASPAVEPVFLTALEPQSVNGHHPSTDPDQLRVTGGMDQPGPDHDRRDENPQRDGRLAPAPPRPAARTTIDGEPADDPDGQRADEETDLSAVAAMRRFWDTEISKGRIPTGAELSRAAGVPPQTGLGRRKRREWEAELPSLGVSR